MNCPSVPQKKKKKKNASQLPLFSGVGITSTDKWQNVVSTQEPLCLLSCPCPVSTSVCDDVDVDHYRLYDAANELWQFETEFQCLFHSGQVTRFVVPLTCCCYFFSVLLHAPVETHSVCLFFFFFGFFCLIPQNDRSGLCTGRKCRICSFGSAWWRCSRNLIHWLKLQCHFLQIPGRCNTTIYRVTDYKPVYTDCGTRCTSCMFVSVVCKCVRTPPRRCGVDVHVGNVSCIL